MKIIGQLDLGTEPGQTDSRYRPLPGGFGDNSGDNNNNNNNNNNNDLLAASDKKTIALTSLNWQSGDNDGINGSGDDHKLS
jgi:hypothetical protein